ncbi:hypothetical protein WKT04_02955 [Oscillospiraceae bacterium HCN-4035]|jgi:plasmid segregation protein ParM
MIISVDHGNKSIKTPNALFTSGLISSEGLQGFKTDYICWNGRYYTLTEQRIAYIIDIGGFTIDVLKLRSGHPDLAVVESFEKGVITLYNGIASKCNALYARILEDCDIDEVIRNQPTVLPGEVQQLIRTMTSDFLTEFYNFLRERGVDVSTSKCVFAGGGSLLLRGMIERGNKVAFPIFVEDIHANARGYELLYQSEVAANGQQ